MAKDKKHKKNNTKKEKAKKKQLKKQLEQLEQHKKRKDKTSKEDRDRAKAKAQAKNKAKNKGKHKNKNKKKKKRKGRTTEEKKATSKEGTSLIPYVGADDTDVDIGKARIDKFTKIVQTIPKQNGFLTYFIDVSILPMYFYELSYEELKNFVDIATIPINMSQGFCCVDRIRNKPTLNQEDSKQANKQASSSGRGEGINQRKGNVGAYLATGIEPIWLKLHFEDEVDYELFEFYRTMEEKSLDKVYHYARNNRLAIPKYKILEMSVFNFWEERSSAYVIQRVAASANSNSTRQAYITDTGYHAATTYMEMINVEFERRSNLENTEPLGDMTGAQLLKAFTELIASARVSTGLPRFGVNSEPTIQVNTNIKQTVEEASHRHNGHDVDNAGMQEQHDMDLNKYLLDNPEDYAILQDIAIKAKDDANTKKDDDIRRKAQNAHNQY